MMFDYTLELYAGPIWLCELRCTAHYKSDINGRYLDCIEAHDNAGEAKALIVRDKGKHQHIWDQSVACLDTLQAQIDEAWSYYSPSRDPNDEHRHSIRELV